MALLIPDVQPFSIPVFFTKKERKKETENKCAYNMALATVVLKCGRLLKVLIDIRPQDLCSGQVSFTGLQLF